MTTTNYHVGYGETKLRLVLEATAAFADYRGVKATFYNIDTGEQDQAFHVGVSGPKNQIALLHPEWWDDSTDFPTLMDTAARYIRLAKFYGQAVEDYKGYIEPGIFLVDPQKFVMRRADFVSVPDKTTLDHLVRELLD